MPDDDITVLVWVESYGDATMAYHDSDVLERRGDSGWIMAGTTTSAQVLIGVTHWCGNINPPNCWRQGGHVLKWVRNIYGDEINERNGMRSEWKCSNCGSYHMRPELRRENAEAIRPAAKNINEATK